MDFQSSSLLTCNKFSMGKDESMAARSQSLLSIMVVKSLIFQLPDELLVTIVELAASGPGVRGLVPYTTTYNNDTLLMLSQVCHRTRRIAQPLLFHDIRIDFSDEVLPPSIPVSKLHQTLSERADLRQHCRILHMYIPDIGRRLADTYSVAKDFTHWLTRTKSLSFHGGFDDNYVSDRTGEMGNEHTWRLLRRMTSKFGDLEHLHISRECRGLYLPPILKWLTFPKLKTLNITGISEWIDDPIELQPEKQRTAAFTSLSIYGYNERPEATPILIQWPAVLTHFKFGSVYNNSHVMDYPMFESWLLIHQHTLKRIEIGFLSGHGRSRLFNATLFPNLEYLRVSRWQMHCPVHLTPEDRNVLGPSLKTFAWDFDFPDRGIVDWRDLGQREAGWLRELAEFAVSHNAALTKIEIQFAPKSFMGATEEKGYPWDPMDILRDQTLKPNGMELVYNKPPITKDAWLKFVRTGKFEDDANDAVVDAIAEKK